MQKEISYQHMLTLGFAPEQIEHLCQLRRLYDERERKQMKMERHRLEFARWLVSTGRLTDGLPEVSVS